MEGLDHITRDIGRKLASDIGDSARRNMLLVEGSEQAFFVAMYGASAALACAAAAFQVLHPDLEAEAIAQGLLEELKPMVGRAVAAVSP